jgi:aspartate kinase
MGGTIIREEKDLERLETRETLAGIVHDLDVSRVALTSIRTGPGTMSRIFTPLAEADISVDVIVESGTREGTADVAFTVGRADFATARSVAGEVAACVGARSRGKKTLAR